MAYLEQLELHVSAAAAALDRSPPLLRTARGELARALRVLERMRPAPEPAEAIYSALGRIEDGKAQAIGEIRAKLEALRLAPGPAPR